MCESSYSSPLSIQLEHQGCWTTRAYRLKFCALTCPEGRCCSPSHSRTVWMVFRCPQGSITHQQVMMIESCFCSSSNCQQYPVTPGRTLLPWLWGVTTPLRKTGRSVRKLEDENEWTHKNVSMQKVEPVLQTYGNAIIRMWNLTFEQNSWDFRLYIV